MQQAATDAIEAPGRAAKEATDAVGQKIEDFGKDDGRVLDTSSPAGTVGALAVACAVLPYIPLSFYSSFLVLTTGRGLEPGPYNVYGIAEGLGTLAVFLFALWSATSFITRARGLPEGPFGLLGATQALSYVAVVFFGVATALSGGENLNPQNSFNFELPRAEDVQRFSDGVSKAGQTAGRTIMNFDYKGAYEGASTTAGKVATDASSTASTLSTSVQGAVKEASSTAQSVGSSVQGAAKDAIEAAKSQAAKEQGPAQKDDVKRPETSAASEAGKATDPGKPVGAAAAKPGEAAKKVEPAAPAAAKKPEAPTPGAGKKDETVKANGAQKPLAATVLDD